MSDDLQRSMGRVEAKVDLILERQGKQDDRISTVEKKVWYGSGASAVIAFIATKVLGTH